MKTNREKPMKVYVVVYEGDALGVYLTPEAATLAGCALEDEKFIVSVRPSALFTGRKNEP
jgi:hypothetical protein